MKPEDYSLDIGNLKKMMKNHQKKGKELFFNALFKTGAKEYTIIEQGTYDDLSLLSDHLKCDNPDDIRLEFYHFNDGKKISFPRKFTLNAEKTEEIVPTAQFKGFGEAEINNMVDQRIKEQKQIEEFFRLKKSEVILLQEIKKKDSEIESLEEEIEQLQTELESKKHIRYYAGMLGDILEGIGISKEKIRNPIASLMGITDDEKGNTETQTEKHEDRSGLVDDEPTEQTETPLSKEEQERGIVIALITDYLNAADNITLAKVFKVFSEIEHNGAMADEILYFLQSRSMT